MPSPRSLDLSQFVGAALRLRRELWHAVSSTGGPVEQGFLPISREALRTWKEKLETDLAPYGNPDVLEQLGLLVDGGRRARVSLLETHALLRAFLCHGSRFSKEVNLEKLRADVMYLLYRDLRATYGISGLSEVASVFRTLCKLLDQTNDVRSFHQEQRQAHGQHLDLFLDVAFSLEELEHGPPATDFRVRQEWLDPNFLVSRLFGFRTAITGFDVLFDGGVSLTDSGPGRVILIRGPFGSGKSILSLGLAAEVVRKGGFAAVIPLDDTTSAIESYLASFGLLEGLKPLSSRKERFDAVLVGGRLEVLHRRELRTSRAALFSELQKQALEARPPPEPDRAPGEAAISRPILLVIDPVNSVLGLGSDPVEVRDELGVLIESVREAGANLLMVAERDDFSDGHKQADSHRWLDELPYMADMVIDLSSERVHEYEQRFVEIKKSRFQRERRGRHAVSIVPGMGFSVAPSSAAVLSQRSPARVPAPDAQPLTFGWPEFDELMGPLKQGHTLAFRGPQGSLKTLVALRFLARAREETTWGHLKRRSLFLTDRSNRPLRAYNEAYQLTENAVGLVDQATFSSGHVQPGRLLLDIQQHFARARDQGFIYDRVAFANAGRWDLTCPFIRNDPGFGAALLELFHREGASVIFVCAEKETERDSMLQRVLVDRVAALVDFERVEHNGAFRVLCRVIRTASEPGSHDWHEATAAGGGLRLSPTLLRLCDTGPMSPPEVREVKTTLRLFTAARRPEEDHYLQALEHRLQSVLMTPVNIEKVDGTILTDAVELGSLSAASNLHIIQIDEFQLPVLKSSRLLHSFQRSQWESFGGTGGTGPFDPEIPGTPLPTRENSRLRLRDLDSKELARVSVDQRVVAVPYYENIALLTVQRDPRVNDRMLGSWTALRTAAAKLEPKLRQDELFFDFSKQTNENYCCLFLEMLMGFEDRQPFAGEEGDAGREPAFEALQRWIKGGAFSEALDCFAILCRKAHRASAPATEPHGPGVMAKCALVTRQWYLSLVGSDSSAVRYVVHPLPGGAAVSGEWYLGVWARSAVPDIGFRIIMDELTSRKAEFDRLQQHVGLPATTQFYDRADHRAFFPSSMTVAANLNLRALIQGARRRSDIPKYHLFSPVLAQHLKDLLSQPRARIRATAEGLIDHTRIVLGSDPGIPASKTRGKTRGRR